MVDPKELEKLGKDISQDFIQHKVPLNSGLKKLASEHGLNKQQIRRVAENANVETYLSLIKKAEDKYLKFDLADASKVYEDITKHASKEEMPLDEYTLDNDTEVSEIFNLYKQGEASLHSEDEINKIINNRNIITNTDGEFQKKSNYLHGVTEYLDNHFVQAQGKFVSNIEQLEKLVKQAILQDTTFSDVSNVIKTAAKCTGEAATELFKERLSKNIIHIDFEKEAEFSSSLPKKESKLYKVANEMESDFLYSLKLEEAFNTLKDEYSQLRKENNAPDMLKTSGFFNTASESFKWFKEHPKTSAAIAMLASYKVGKATSKPKAQKKVPLTKSQINLRLQQYK